jgi:hypothetical protein
MQSQLENMSHFQIEKQYKIDKKNQNILRHILDKKNNEP